MHSSSWSKEQWRGFGGMIFYLASIWFFLRAFFKDHHEVYLANDNLWSKFAIKNLLFVNEALGPCHRFLGFHFIFYFLGSPFLGLYSLMRLRTIISLFQLRCLYILYVIVCLMTRRIICSCRMHMPNMLKSTILELLDLLLKRTTKRTWKTLLLEKTVLTVCGGSKFVLKLHIFRWLLQMTAFALQKLIPGMFLKIHFDSCTLFIGKFLFGIFFSRSWQCKNNMFSFLQLCFVLCLFVNLRL